MVLSNKEYKWVQQHAHDLASQDHLPAESEWKRILAEAIELRDVPPDQGRIVLRGSESEQHRLAIAVVNALDELEVPIPKPTPTPMQAIVSILKHLSLLEPGQNYPKPPTRWDVWE